MLPLIEFDLYITPDGVLYNLEDLKDRAIIGSVTGQGMAPLEYQTQRGPQQHGDTIIGYRLSPRVMQMVHRRNACDRQGNWDHRDELLDVLRPNRVTLGPGGRPLPGQLRKIRPDGSIRDIDVLIEFETGHRYTYFTLAQIEDELASLLGRKVDLHMPKTLHPFLRDKVLGQAEAVYDGA